jgi:hypothetical protein
MIQNGGTWMDVLAWLLFIALIVAAALIYMRVAKPEIWSRWKNGKHLPYERKERPRIKKSAPACSGHPERDDNRVRGLTTERENC